MILTSLWWDYVVYLPPSQGVLVLWMAYFQYFPEFWKLPVDKFDFAQSVIMLYKKKKNFESFFGEHRKLAKKDENITKAVNIKYII